MPSGVAACAGLLEPYENASGGSAFTIKSGSDFGIGPNPHEDLIDALRGGVRDRFPEGRVEQPRLSQVHASGFA